MTSGSSHLALVGALLLALAPLGAGASTGPTADALAPPGPTSDALAPPGPATDALASPGPTADAFTPPEHGGLQPPFRGPAYRWPVMSVIPRVLHDLIAVPASVVAWDATDWGRFATFGGAILFLMAPTDPSPDSRLDLWLIENADPVVPDIWGAPFQAALWGSLALTGFGIWGWATVTDRPDIAQAMSLTGEALAVGQFWHVFPKLLMGREGPENGDARGIFYGTPTALDVYPAGTPSGHSGTIYAVLSVNLHYFRPPWWVQAIAHAFAGTIIAMHVVNHRHFLSDSLWGAVSGWFIGDWVVTHRAGWHPFGSDRGRLPAGASAGGASASGASADRDAPTAALVPVALPGGGTGLGLVGRW